MKNKKIINKKEEKASADIAALAKKTEALDARIDGFCQKTINEIHYCFIKYPEQMRDKLPEASQAFHDVADHLDKGYDELRAIIESVDKLGN